jgi:DNA-binding beta-propeller fold protein YncE
VTRLAVSLLSAFAVAVAATPAAAEMRFLTAWGSKGTGAGQFTLPDGVEVDNAGNVWVADSRANRILRFSSEGEPRPFRPFRKRSWTDRDGYFRMPYGLAVDLLGFIYVADTHNHRIQQFAPDGRFMRKWGGFGTGDGQFNQPRGIALDPAGNVWVADHENKRVQKFDREGRFLLKVGANGGDGSPGRGAGEFNSPRGLASDALGNVYVADDSNSRIVKLRNDGTFVANFGYDLALYQDNSGSADGQYNLPYDTAVDPEGHVWVADTKNHRLVEIDPNDGRFLSRWGANGGGGTAGHGLGEFDHTFTVAVDCVGNVYVSDAENHRIQKFGDPASPRPVCPPRLSVRELGGRGAVTAEVVCDRPCRASAAATVRVRGRTARMRSRERLLWQAGSVTLRLGLPAAIRRVLRSGERLAARVTVTAEGAPGASRSVRRTVRLR